ncbi:hypothetical protein [Methylotuvimicrobium sp. KM2]
MEQKSALPPTPVDRATAPSSEPTLFFHIEKIDKECKTANFLSKE